MSIPGETPPSSPPATATPERVRTLGIGPLNRLSIGEYRASDRIAVDDFASLVAKVLKWQQVASVNLDPGTHQPPIKHGDVLIPLGDLRGTEEMYKAKNAMASRGIDRFIGTPVISVGRVVNETDDTRRAEKITESLLPHLTEQMDAAFLTCDEAVAVDNIYNMLIGKGTLFPLPDTMDNLALETAEEIKSAFTQPANAAAEGNLYYRNRKDWFSMRVVPLLSEKLRQHFMKKILPRFDGNVNLEAIGGYHHDNSKQPGDVRTYKTIGGEYKVLDDAKYRTLEGDNEGAFVQTYLRRDLKTLCEGVEVKGEGHGEGYRRDRLQVFYNFERSFIESQRHHKPFSQGKGEHAFFIGFQLDRTRSPNDFAREIKDRDQVKVRRLYPPPATKTGAA